MTQHEQHLTAVRQHFGLATKPARLLLLLYRATVPLSAQTILTSIPKTREHRRVSANIVRVWINAIRSALGSAAVATTYGAGYTLQPTARATLDELFSNIGVQT